MAANPINPFLLADFYKLSHRPQYPPGTEYVYSTWIARKSYMAGVDHTVAFGFQRFVLKYLVDYFNENFFDRDKEEVLAEYDRIVTNTLGGEPDHEHLARLHDLGFLPLRIKALPEGTVVPLRVPTLTIENTIAEYFWLTNFIESLMSSELWLSATSATIAHEYRKLLDEYATKTNPEAADFVDFQGHDFSMRGMSSVESGCASGLGHLLSFRGTDTIPAIVEAERYYGADVTKELVGTSIAATEHSVVCAGGVDDEEGTYRHLLTDVYPTGMFSSVSDTWNLWGALEMYGTTLHDVIMSRDGKMVVRPDSGNPVDILCGTAQFHPNTYKHLEADRDRRIREGYAAPDERSIYTGLPEQKGVIELLWEYFGGAISSTGYKVLDPHIGVIYGDSITTERARQICERLEAKGFASTNVVLGIGSYTYQFQTRDTFGTAMKATWVQINGEERAIFKDPITDSGMKKSLTGRVVVRRNAFAGEIQVIDGLTKAEALNYQSVDMLTDIFVNGIVMRTSTLSEVRETLAAQ